MTTSCIVKNIENFKYFTIQRFETAGEHVIVIAEGNLTADKIVKDAGCFGKEMESMKKDNNQGMEKVDKELGFSTSNTDTVRCIKYDNRDCKPKEINGSLLYKRIKYKRYYKKHIYHHKNHKHLRTNQSNNEIQTIGYNPNSLKPEESRERNDEIKSSINQQPQELQACENNEVINLFLHSCKIKNLRLWHKEKAWGGRLITMHQKLEDIFAREQMLRTFAQLSKPMVSIF